ncbi:MAG: hypothetical protein GY754_36575 [bacterium]|nr:hypothetical protein [bacterium]
MKKIIIIISILIFSIFYMQQEGFCRGDSFSLNIDGGYGVSDSVGELKGGESQPNSGYLVGVQLGIFIAGKPWGAKLSSQILLGVEYVSKPIEFNLGERYINTINLSFKNFTLRYRGLYKLLYFDVGGFYGLINKDSKWYIDDKYSATTSIHIEDVKKRGIIYDYNNDYGLLTGVGLSIPLSKDLRLNAGLEFQIGFPNLIQLDDDEYLSSFCLMINAGITVFY